MKNLSSREKLYMGVFAVTLVWGIWNFREHFTGGSPEPAVKQVTMPQAVQPPAADPTLRQAGFDLVEHYTPPQWSRDPFHRTWRNQHVKHGQATTPEVRYSDLELSAVVVRPDGRYAVINGRILQEGHTINGLIVLRIEQSRVLMDDKGLEVTLEL